MTNVVAFTVILTAVLIITWLMDRDWPMPGMTRCPTCEHPVLVLCDVTTDQAVTVDAVPFTLTGTWQVIDLLTGTATPTPRPPGTTAPTPAPTPPQAAPGEPKPDQSAT